MVKKKRGSKVPKKKAPANKGKKMTTSTKKTKKTTKKKSPTTAKKKTGSKAKTSTRKKTASNPKPAAMKKTTKNKAPVKATKPAKSSKTSMTPSEVKECRHQLLMKRALILGDLSKMEIAALRASEQDSSTDNIADYGTDNYEQAFTLGLIESVEGVVKEIDDALKRMDQKKYGICENCGCAIPKARIKALPYARHCVQCQSDLEQTL